MKCPHCNYQHGWCGDSMKNEEGCNGEFYKLPVQLERPVSWSSNKEGADLYGCPECNKTFIY